MNLLKFNRVMHPTEIILLLITFLDSLCIGIVAPVLSAHIRSHKGNHLIVGFMAAGMYFCSLLSKVFIDIAFRNHGKKSVLFMSSIISFISYAIILLIPFWWAVLFSRYLFALTNRRELLCKDIAKTVNSDEQYYNLMEVFDLSGIVIGPIIGGHLYDMENMFVYNGVYALILMSINTFFVYSLPVEEIVEENIEDVSTFFANCVQRLKNICHISYIKQWHFILLKLIYLSCCTVFFSKFSVILNNHFEFGSILIGYTIAYQNIIVFGANYVLPDIKRFLVDFSKDSCFSSSLILFSFCLPYLYLTSHFDHYLIVFIVMVLLRAIIENYWLEIIDENLEWCSNYLRFLIGIFVPPSFGYLCDEYGVDAFQVLGSLPIAVGIFVAKNGFTGKKIVEDNVENTIMEKNDSKKDD